MADFDAQLPVRALAANFTTEVANATGTTVNPAEDYAQGSTTSGENNVLVAGATTTNAPTYVTATTPLSLDTSGNLRVKDFADGSASPGTAATVSTLAGGIYNSTPPTATNGQQVSLQVDANGRLLVDTNASASIVPVLTYFTDAAVASSATVTHSLAGPVNLDKIEFGGSGEVKMTVAIGITGSEVTYWNGFTSSAEQNRSFLLPYTYNIPTGSSAKVTLKNRDTAAQDTYLTFFSH